MCVELELQSQPKLQPYQGSVGEAYAKLKELRRLLILDKIDQATFESEAAPYAEIINRKIKVLVEAGVI